MSRELKSGAGSRDELRATDSWLSITGLFVLREGEQSIGSDATNDIPLPASAPAHLGSVEFLNGKAHLTVNLGATVLIDGQPLEQADLVDNGERKKPTLVTAGTVTFFVHKFGDRYAIRVKDSANPAIQNFGGRTWFDVKPEYKLEGRFTPHDARAHSPSRQLLTRTPPMSAWARLTLKCMGKRSLYWQQNGAARPRLHIVFRDATAGVESYAPGRFLTVEVEEGGRAVVDFNKAYNPPCAFSPYATCPLPPRQIFCLSPLQPANASRLRMGWRRRRDMSGVKIHCQRRMPRMFAARTPHN